MANSNGLLILVLSLAPLTGATAAGCGSASAAPTGGAASGLTDAASGVALAEPPSQTARQPGATAEATALVVAGDLRPAQSAEVAFKIGGQLAAIRVARGAKVASGSLLAQLADREAIAQLAQARAVLRAAEARAALAADHLHRIRSLAAAQAVPESQLTVATLESQAAAAAVEQCQAAVALARAALANHQLRAPFAGYVVRVPDGPGGIVAAGAPIVRLEQLDRLVLHATVGEGDLGRVRVGDVVRVLGAGGVTAPGRVRTMVGSLETMSRRAPVEIEVPNASGALLAGAYVRAVLRSPEAREPPAEPGEPRASPAHAAAVAP